MNLEKLYEDDELKSKLLKETSNLEELYEICSKADASLTPDEFEKFVYEYYQKAAEHPKEVSEGQLSLIAGGRMGDRSVDKKIASLVLGGLALGSSMGIGGTPKASAYEPYRVLKIYNTEDVSRIAKEAKQLFKECEAKVSKLQDSNSVIQFTNEIADIKKESGKSFTLERNAYYNYTQVIEDLKALRKKVDVKLQVEEKKKSEDQERKRLLEIQREKDLKEQEAKRKNEQRQEFESRKSTAFKNFESLKRQVELTLDLIEDRAAFEPTAKTLKADIDLELSKLENISFSEDFYTEDVSAFSHRLDDLFKDLNANLEFLESRVNKLSTDVQKVKKDFERQLIELARDEMNARINEYERRIIDEFSAQGIEGPVGDSIREMGNELAAANGKLGDEVARMTNIDEKVTLETEFRLFDGKYNRMYERKKKKVDDYLREQRREINLENLHNFDAQLELLRCGDLELNDVVGGYKSVISRMGNLIDTHVQRHRTGKGVPSKGMILYGEPGTGKTSLVRAVAASKKMNLVTLKRRTDGSDMRNEIKARFDEAKTLTDNGKNTVVLLVDEIDALGSIRIPGETDKETVALLAEIDALKPSDNVVIIATTNLLSSVDAAVKRSGRLEDCCEVARPREDEILEILKISLKGYKLEDGVTLDDFVAGFVSSLRGCCGADVKRVAEIAVQTKIKFMKEPRLSDLTITRGDIEMAIKSLNIRQS